MTEKINIISYTDGSSLGNPGPGGWGALVAYPDRVVELGGAEEETTNNRMELTAAIKVLELIGKTNAHITLHTDSAYVLNGITKWVHGWRARGWVTATKDPVLNRDLWERLFALANTKDVSWNKVSGHVGIPGNERADTIATSFAMEREPALYKGPRAKYERDVCSLHEEPPQGSAQSKRKRSTAKAHSYVSLIDGVLKRHSTWAECEKRVRGKQGAKYRKTISAEDEKQIIAGWGL